MDKRTFAFSLLSLFTTRQRAVEIEGDLLEESEYRGRLWFSVHVLSVTLALFRESIKEAPWKVAALVAIATELAFLTCYLQRSLFASRDALYPSPLLATLVIPLCGFLIGAGLGYFVSKLAVRAAALTAAVLSCLLLFSLIDADAARITAASTSNPIMLVVKAAFSIAFSFAQGIALFISPLIAGSICRRDFRIAG